MAMRAHLPAGMPPCDDAVHGGRWHGLVAAAYRGARGGRGRPGPRRWWPPGWRPVRPGCRPVVGWAGMGGCGLMATSWWWLGLGLLAVAGGWSLIGGGLGVKLGAQPRGLAGGAAHPPSPSARRVARPARAARCAGCCGSAAASRWRCRSAASWGELVHGGPSPFPAAGGLSLCSHCHGPGGRSPYVAAHRRGTGLGWAVKPGRAPDPGGAGAGRVEGARGLWSMGRWQGRPR